MGQDGMGQDGMGWDGMGWGCDEVRVWMEMGMGMGIGWKEIVCDRMGCDGMRW